MPNENEDSDLKRRLLSPPPSVSSTDKMIMENEKSKKSKEDDRQADLSLHDAVCDSDNLDEIIELISTNPALLYEKDDEGRTALHTLCKDGDEKAPEIARIILGVTEFPDGSFQVLKDKALQLKDDGGYTALHYAARNWFPELTEFLLQCGADPKAQDLRGHTPLHLAAESGIEGALHCATLLLKYDASGSLINMKNTDEVTALHRAVKIQAVQMVKLLLESEHLNLSSHTNSTGQNMLHYLCVESGETKKSCEILKMIIDSCTPGQLNSCDMDERSALHIAAIERLPKITSILVAESQVDLLKVDKRKRTALHYAAENGSYPDGHQCVEHLMSRQFPRTKTQIQYLYEMQDEIGSSSFMYACLNCPVETVQKYLGAIREPQFWMSETNMLLVYKQCPLAIKALMDGAFAERKRLKSSEMDVIVTDFGPITGYKDPVDAFPQQESKYLKNALLWDYATQKEILTHPLVQLFVVKKCQKLQTIIYSWVLWQLIWLTAYTFLGLTTYCKDVLVSPTTAIVSSVIIVIYIIVSFINEIFEFNSVGFRYLRSVSNIFQLIQIVLGAVAVSPVLFGMEVSILHKNCAAIGVLLAYILSMRDIGKMHEEIGLVVEVLKQVVIQIVKVLLCCSPLLVGFTMAFLMLFGDDDSLNTTFPGPLVKVLVMMTGEFEYNDTFKDGDKEENGATNPDGTKESEEAIKNRAIRLLLFLSFLICVPVAFFNLLTGFALERVMELRERAKVGRIAKQLDHIYFIESILLSLHPLKKFLPHGRFSRMLRKYNVTTALIDGDLKFETFLNEETRKKIDRRTPREKQFDLCHYCRSIFGTELPSEVRHKIFALASKQRHSSEEQ